MRLLGLIYLSITVDAIFGESIDVDLSVDRTGWLDPNDPLATSVKCTKQTIDELFECRSQLELLLQHSPSAKVDCKSREKTTDPTLKHIVRSMLTRMDVDLKKTKWVQRSVNIYLSDESLSTLLKFLNSDAESLSQREQVRAILEEMIVQDEYHDLWAIERALQYITPFYPIFGLLIVSASLFVLIRTRLSMKLFIQLIFCLSFVMSIYNTYQKKMQENLAMRMARMDESIREKCKPKGFLSTAFDAFNGLFAFKHKSECLQYYEDIYVNPLTEISPLDIISDVLSNFVFTPLGIFGRHSNKFFDEFYRDTPLHIVIVKTLIFCFLVPAFLFWICGYRLRTIFATLEPAGHTTPIRSTVSDDHLLGVSRMLSEHSPGSKKPITSRRRSLSAGRLMSG